MSYLLIYSKKILTNRSKHIKRTAFILSICHIFMLFVIPVKISDSNPTKKTLFCFSFTGKRYIKRIFLISLSLDDKKNFIFF
jgi:hypothetical protein